MDLVNSDYGRVEDLEGIRYTLYVLYSPVVTRH